MGSCPIFSRFLIFLVTPSLNILSLITSPSMAMTKLGLFVMVVVANIVDIMPEVTYVIVPISEDVLAKIQDKVAPVSDDALQGIENL